MLSEGMRAALAGNDLQRDIPWAETATSLVALGNVVCGSCGIQCSQLEFEMDGETPTGPLYENRQHIRKGVKHVWPQLHVCLLSQNARLTRRPESPDTCPICAGCKAC